MNYRCKGARVTRIFDTDRARIVQIVVPFDRDEDQKPAVEVEIGIAKDDGMTVAQVKEAAFQELKQILRLASEAVEGNTFTELEMALDDE